MMPLPQFWAVCFFLMLVFLGLDTVVSSVYFLWTKRSFLLSYLECLIAWELETGGDKSQVSFYCVTVLGLQVCRFPPYQCNPVKGI